MTRAATPRIAEADVADDLGHSVHGVVGDGSLEGEALLHARGHEAEGLAPPVTTSLISSAPHSPQAVPAARRPRGEATTRATRRA